MKFSELKFEEELLSGLEAMQFQNMTPVQELTIPLILEGRDLIACAQTGTGKTAAYLLPILNRLSKERNEKGTNTIIVAPTRELAMQIDQQLQGFAYFIPASSIAVYGGGDPGIWDQQKKALSQGADIVIATPGRMISHMKLGYVNLDSVQHLILDEADRMLDMGFHEDIMQIVNKLPKERQTLMFSATMPPKIRDLAKKILCDPQEVNIAISKPAEGILQAAYVCYDDQKLELLSSLLEGKDLNGVIIFASTKSSVKKITQQLKKKKFEVEAIHSDLEQGDREEVLRLFKNQKLKILVATDILSRGIDIDKLELVVNYEVPRDPEDYVHRVGRTARAQNKGVAITFINDKDQNSFWDIEHLIEKDVYKVPLPAHMEKGPEYNPNPRKKKKKKFRKKR